MRRIWRRWAVGVVAAATVGLSAAPGGAASWSQQGGDPGRPGTQVVDQGGVPAELAWSSTGLADRDVRTSVITSAGQPNEQRVAYGTEDGVILVRILISGAPVGPAGGTDLSADALPFGGLGSVGFVESSTEAGLGQIFVVHNETYAPRTTGGPPVHGLELAQVDESTGLRVRDDIALDGTENYRIESSPLLTAPDAGGNRTLFFVGAEIDGTNQKLFRIPIANAASPSATIGAVSSTPDVNANPVASPTLVTLRDAGGAATSYVAVATLDGIRTFSVAGLADGPSASGLGAPARTPSVPPGAPSVLVVASGGAGSTVVHRLTQTANEQVLADAASPALAGAPAPALAFSSDGTRILVTTSANLYGLASADLSVAARFNATDDLVATTTGFSRTTAVTTGVVVFVVTDGGRQLALDQDTLQPVDADLFAPPRTAAASAASYGQPAISRRFLQVTTDRGIFVYGLRRATPPTGYWLAASDGGIFAYGDARFAGSTGDLKLNKPIVTMAPTPSREGYWLAASDGGIFAFGDAGFFGSTGNLTLNSPVVGMVPTRTGQGYWLVAADGGVFAFGDAVFLGSTGDVKLNKPIVGMASTVTGEGYYLVASDGGIFTFGDAEFQGSTGNIALNKPIVGMARVPAGGGYWLVASDGGVFAFGRRAAFFGSTGDIRLNSPIVGITPSATGLGYVFVAADGGVFAFGDAPFLGSAASLGPLNKPVVTIAAKP